MSLMKTLAKVAIGMAVAKGVGSVMKGAQAQPGARNPGNGGLFGGTHSPNAQAQGTGLEDLMGSILGGGQASGGAAQQGGGLGSLLEQLGGGGMGGRPTGAQQGGSLGDLLGSLTGGQRGGAAAGGAGDALGGLLGGLMGKMQQNTNSQQGSFGEVFSSSFDQNPTPQMQPTADQEAAAALMLSAMIQAAKSDGKFDQAEQEKLMAQLGEIDREERDFVQAEMRKPVDVDGLARAVPRGMEGQVYAMSILGIDLDNQNEAQYLHQLATKMGISQAEVNNIHDQMGVPPLYS